MTKNIRKRIFQIFALSVFMVFWGASCSIITQESSVTVKDASLTVKDADGNIYKMVKIGTQVWMSENLRTTKLNDGKPILLVTGKSAWAKLTSPGYCWYDNGEAGYKDTYGALYNWYAVNTGILCPTGWHLPSDSEWTQLTDYLGGKDLAGGKLKETGTTHWERPNIGATNESGFTALPGSFRYKDGIFLQRRCVGYWWSSTEKDAKDAVSFSIDTEDGNISRANTFKESGYSVRCVKD